MQVQEAVDEYLFAVKNLSDSTQKWYKRTLKVFVGWCERQGIELEQVKITHVRRFLAFVSDELPNQRTGQKLSEQSIHGYAQVVKGFLNWCGKEDGYDDVVKPALSKKIDMPRVEKKVIETFTPEQLSALLKACEREYTDELQKRDTAILSLLIDTGIRASELCTLTLDRVSLDRDDPFIRVKGKGKKEREVGLGSKARTALQRYISRYRGVRKIGAKKNDEHVFLNRYGEPLTVYGLDQLIERLGDWAHVKGVRCSPHTFRHTYAVTFLQATGDIYRLSRLLGHGSVAVTEVYLRSVKAKDARSGGRSVLDNLR